MNKRLILPWSIFIIFGCLSVLAMFSSVLESRLFGVGMLFLNSWFFAMFMEGEYGL